MLERERFKAIYFPRAIIANPSAARQIPGRIMRGLVGLETQRLMHFGAMHPRAWIVHLKAVLLASVPLNVLQLRSDPAYVTGKILQSRVKVCQHMSLP